LGQAKIEIFLQMGLDRQLTGLPADLPDGHLSNIRHCS
jgi:hypothetical protein